MWGKIKRSLAAVLSAAIVISSVGSSTSFASETIVANEVSEEDALVANEVSEELAVENTEVEETVSVQEMIQEETAEEEINVVEEVPVQEETESEILCEQPDIADSIEEETLGQIIEAEGEIIIENEYIDDHVDDTIPESSVISVDEFVTTSGIWQYYLDEDAYVHIVQCTEEESETLTVPIEIDGYLVRYIEDGAFSNLNQLRNIKISFYIKKIAENAFADNAVTIQSYAGAYALAYAAKQGMPVKVLSEYDFSEQVLDLTEIIPTHYSFINNTDIRMNILEAEALSVGSVFYLPPSEMLSMGDAFKINAIEQTTDGQVILRCERAIGQEVVNSIDISDQNILPDWNAAVYYYDTNEDGLYEEYTLLEIAALTEVGVSASVANEMSFKDSVEIFNHKSTYGSSKVKVDYDVTFGITAAVDANIDVDWNNINLETFDVSVSEEISGTISLSGACASSIPIAEVPLYSVGVATIYAELSLELSADGKITYNMSFQQKNGLKYDSASNSLKPYSTLTKDASCEGQINAKAGLLLEAGFHIMFLGDVVKMNVGAGVEASFSVSIDYASCADLESEIYVLATASTDFSNLSGEFAKKLSKTFTLLDKSYPLFDQHYELSDKWRGVPECTYGGSKYEVSFYTGRSFSVSSEKVNAGSKVQEPVLLEEETGGETLLGWKQENASEYWDFENDTVSEDITLFAVWGSDVSSEYTVAYVTEGMDTFYQNYEAGAKVEEPSAIVRNDYIFRGWYFEDTFTNAVDFADLYMPEEDLTLYGLWEYHEGYDPWQELIDSLTDETKNFTYTVSKDGYATITGYTGSSSTLEVPETLGGYKVTAIGERAFNRKRVLQNVTLPEGLKSIGIWAFAECTNLKSIVLPSTLEELGEYAFYKSGISEIDFSGCDIEVIEGSTFAECRSLETLTLPGTINEIRWRAFSYCTSLEAVVIPNGTEYVGSNAFAFCSNLLDISVPDTLNYLSSDSFADTAWESEQQDGLVYIGNWLYTYKGDMPENTSVSIKSGTKLIAVGIFQDETNLVSVTLNDEMETITPYAFSGCIQLKEVEFNDNLTEIGERAFYGCTELSELNLPDSLMIIDEYAFYRCSKLTELILPENLKQVAGAFEYNVGLQKIVFNSGIKFGSIDSPTDQLEIVFTDKVKNIPESCISIKDHARISIGKNVESIEAKAFAFSDASINVTVLYNAIDCKSLGMQFSYGATNTYKLILGEDVQRIPEKAFYRENYLSEIDYSNAESVSYIGKQAFEGTAWFDKQVENEPGIIYIGKCLYRCFGDLECEELVIKSNTEMICANAFYNNYRYNGQYIYYNYESVKKVVLPDTLREIGDYAFYEIDSINQFLLPESLEILGSNVFDPKTEYYGYGWWEIYIPASVKEIGKLIGGYPGEYKQIICKPGSYAEQYAKESGYDCYYIYDDYPYLALNRDRTRSLELIVAQTDELSFPETVISRDTTTWRSASMYSESQEVNLETIKTLVLINNEQYDFSFQSYNSTVGQDVQDLPNVETLVLGKNVTKIDYNYLSRYPALRELHIADGNTEYKEIGDFVYNSDGTELIYYNGLSTKIEIPDSVEMIGSYAFSNKGNIDVTIGSHVAGIAENAFENSVPQIYAATGSFAENYALNKNYTFISNGITEEVFVGQSNGNDGFAYLNKKTGCLTVYGECYWTTNMFGPDVVKSVYLTANAKTSDTFSSVAVLPSSVSQITMDENNTNFAVVDNMLYTSDKETLLFCPEMEEVVIPEGTKCINREVFERYDKLRKVVFPSTLEEIEGSAFERCGGLTSIELPEGLEYIGSYCFYNCTALEEVILPSTLKRMEDNAFGNCSALTSIILPDNLEHMGYYCFAHCNSLQQVYWNSITGIPYGAFFKCENLAEIWISDSVQSIEDNAFEDSGLQTIYGSENSYAQLWAAEHGYEFKSSSQSTNATYSYSGLLYKIEAGNAIITGVAGNVSSSCTIPESINGVPVIEIAEDAFRGNSAIYYLTIPASVAKIGEGAFLEMSNLREIVVADGNTSYCSVEGGLYNLEKTHLYVYPAYKSDKQFIAPETLVSIGEKAFYSNEYLEDIILNEGLETIGEYAFSGAAKLNAVTFPSTLSEIGMWAFYNAGEVSLYGPVEECAASKYAVQYGMDYNIYHVQMINNGKRVIEFEQQAGEVFENPISSVSQNDHTLTGWYSDEACTKLWDFETDTMPAEDLTLYAGWVCDYTYESLENGICITGVNVDKKYYTIPSVLDGNNVVAIAADAFSGTDIVTVRIPTSVTTIAEGAFAEGITIYGDEGSEAQAFAEQYEFEFGYRYYTVEFDSRGGSSIGSYSYRMGALISEVTVPVRDNYSFAGWYRDSKLTVEWKFDTDTMPEGGLTLYAKWNKINSNLQDLTFDYTYGTDGIVLSHYKGNGGHVVIPASINGKKVVAIGDMAFSNCETVTNIIISDGIESIGEYAFSGCDNLKTVVIPDTVLSIEQYAFSGCESLTSFTFPNQLSKVSNGVLQYCKSLRKIVIPASVETIGANAFNSCSYLNDIELSSGVTAIGDRAFYGCEKLTEITIPDTVSEIHVDAFSRCPKMKSINVSGNNKTYCDIDGVLFDFNGTSLLRYPEGKSDITYIVPEEVMVIGPNAFRACRNLTNITVPEGLALIGKQAFYNCDRLREINLENTEIYSIDAKVFAGCKSLVNCLLPQCLEAIEKYAFMNCTSLKTLQMPEGLTNISENSFLGCSDLKLLCGKNDYALQYAKQNSINYQYLPEKPDAPEISLVREFRIELVEKDGCEYSINGIDWQESGVFDNLLQDTEYTFYQRIKAEEDHSESDMSEGTVISTLVQRSAPEAPEVDFIHQLYIKLVETDGCEYSMNGIDWQKSGLFENLQASTEYTFYQRISADEEYSESHTSQGTTVSTLNRLNISNCTVTLATSEYSYNGTEIHPEIVIRDNDILLEEDVDYSVSCINCVNAGEASIIINGIGIYYGEIAKNFTITPTENYWIEELECSDVVKGMEIQPSAKAAFGTVIFSYAVEEDGIFTENIPTECGTYFVRAQVEGNVNYTSLSEIVSFEIREIRDCPIASVGSNLVFANGDKITLAEFTPAETDFYTIYSIGDNDTRGYLYNETMEIIDSNDDSDDSVNFEISVELEAGQKYYIGVCYYYASYTGDITVVIEKGKVEEQPEIYETEGTIQNGYMDAQVEADESVYYAFTPEVSGRYVICSYSENDTRGYLLDENWNLLISDDDGSEDEYGNFMISADLEAGETYYIGVSFWSSSMSGIINFAVKSEDKQNISELPVTLPNTTYFYTGMEHRPLPEVKFGTKILTEGVDYDLEYQNNVKLGTATITVIGKGEYEGSKKVTFTIKEKEHEWGEKTIVTEPTCIEEGQITRTCKVCGIDRTEQLSALGHKWSDWSTVSEATVFAAEQQIRKCTNVGCNQTESKKVGSPVAGYISLTANSLVMKVKQSTSKFRVTAMANGDSLESVTSSNTKLLRVKNVKSDGTFTLAAQKKTGTAKLTIKLKSGKSKTIKVKIQKKAVKTTAITGISKTVKVKQGSTLKLNPERVPVTSLEKIKYSTSNKKIATVSSKGVIKGIKGGKAKITIQAGKKKFTCTVTVEGVKNTGLKGIQKKLSLKKGASKTLKPKRVPSDSTDKITYSSSNKKVATVSSAGKITAKKKGTAVITVKCGSAKATCKVTVK